MRTTQGSSMRWERAHGVDAVGLSGTAEGAGEAEAAWAGGGGEGGRRCAGGGAEGRKRRQIHVRPEKVGTSFCLHFVLFNSRDR
jgi:hypothetical protein